MLPQRGNSGDRYNILHYAYSDQPVPITRFIAINAYTYQKLTEQKLNNCT